MTIINDGYRNCIKCETRYYEGNRLWLNPLCKDCWNQPERLNPEEVKPMGFKFARKVAIIGTDNPQVFDLCDSLNTTNK